MLTLELDNRDGQWSEFLDVNGKWVPVLSAGVAIRVVSTTDPAQAEANLTYHFLGWVEGWRQSWTKVDDRITVTAHDGWANLVQQADVPWTPGPMGEAVPGRMAGLRCLDGER